MKQFFCLVSIAAFVFCGCGGSSNSSDSGSGSAEQVQVYLVNETIDIDADGQIDTRVKYFYNSSGKLIQEEWDYGNNGSVEEKGTYLWWDNGQMFRENFDFDNNGKIDTCRYHFYDSYHITRELREDRDEDNDGIIDITGYYLLNYSGKTEKEEWDIDLDGAIDQSIYYSYASGDLEKEEYDIDNNGSIDVIIYYEYNTSHKRTTYREDSDNDGTIDFIAYYYYDIYGDPESIRIDQNADDQIDGYIYYSWTTTFLPPSDNILTQGEATNPAVLSDYSLNIPIEDAQFCPQNSHVFVSSESYENQIVYSIDIDPGMIEHEIEFSYRPGAITLSPDETALYVAISCDSHSGYIAQINPKTAELVKNFRIYINPFDLVASSDGHVYATSSSGCIDGYNIISEERIGREENISYNSIIALEPFENALYAVSYDDIARYKISSGEVEYLGDSPYNGEHRIKDGLFIHPDGMYLLSMGGDIFSCSSQQSNDLQFIQEITHDKIYTAAFDKEHDAIFTVESDGIRYYDDTTYELIGIIHLQPDRHNYISFNSDYSEIWYIHNYASSSYLYIIENPLMKTSHRMNAVSNCKKNSIFGDKSLAKSVSNKIMTRSFHR